MRPSLRYLAAVLCAVLLLAICTAGCTSPLTSSPSPQTSAGPEHSQNAGYPPDNAGSDPDPSLVPRYQPSVRLLSPENGGGTGWAFETKSPLSTVKAFYSAEMAKLGYTVAGTENITQSNWSVKYVKDDTTILIHAGRTPPSPIWTGYLPQLTNVTYFGFSPVSAGQEGP
jgi:hypothetical protein